MDTNQLLTLLTTGAVGGALGWSGKWLQSWYDSASKRRDALEDQVLQHVAKFSPGYDLMSNHAYLLARSLILSLKAKLELQLTADATVAQARLNDTIADSARESLYFAAKLYMTIVEMFWVQGGKYYLPEPWAGLAMMDLHGQIMKRLHFRPEKLNPVMKKTSFVHDFVLLVEEARSKTEPDSVALCEQVDQFRDWLRVNDREARELAAYALAYSDLFDQQMGTVWRKRAILQLRKDRPDKPEIDDDVFPHLEKTSEMVGSAAAERARQKVQWSALIDPERLTFNELFGYGWNLYEAGQYDLALIKYEEALKEKPDSPETHNNIANVLSRLRRYSEAEARFRRAIEGVQGIDASRAAIFHFNFGVMWGRQADEHDPKPDTRSHARSEAIAHCKEAVRLAPGNAFYLNELGNAYYRSEQWTEAEEAFGAAVQIAPNEPVIHSNVADVYLQLEQYGPARKHYEEAAARTPAGEKGNDQQKGSYFASIARLLERQENFEEARGYWKQALDCDASNDEYAWKLAGSYRFLKRAMSEEDQALATRVLSSSGGAPNLYRLGLLAFWRGDYLGALDCHSRAVRMDPENAAYHNQLGLTCRKLGFSDVALRSYQRAFDLDPENFDYLRNLALTNQTLRFYGDALVHLNAILQSKPDDVDCKLAAAECHAFGEDHDADTGIRLCNEIIAAHPEDPRPYEVAARIHSGRGKHREALGQLKQAFLKSMAADKRPLLSNMREECDKALEESPDDSNLYDESGRIYDQLGLYDQAIEAYKEARLSGQHEARYQAMLAQTLGNVHYKRKNYDEALREWETALADKGVFTKSELARLLNNIGTALDAMGQFEQALERYAQSAEMAPDTSVAHYNLGLALYRRGLLPRALAEFEESDRLQPRINQPPYQIGNCYYRLGRKELARTRWQEAVARDPGFAEPLSNLGVLDYESGATDQLDEAVKKWRRAIQLSPELAATRRMLDAVDRFETPELSICEAATEKETQPTVRGASS